MEDRVEAPEVLPRCPVCDKIVFCINSIELKTHVEECFKKYSTKGNGKIKNR